MKILIVEDDSYKSTAIKHWIETVCENVEVELHISYKDGCIAALNGGFDFMILDMALPARTQNMSGDTIVNGGELIIREMLDEHVPFIAVIITQYETFNGETIEAIDERLRLLCGDAFRGCVSYNSQDDSWKNNLHAIINDVKGSDC